MLLFNKKKEEGKVLELLKKHCDIEETLLQLFKRKEIDIDELISQINSLRDLRTESLNYLNIKHEEEIIENKIILVQDKEFSKEIIEKYEEAKKEIISVYEVLDKDPVLNLDKVKNFIVEFSHLVKDKDDIKISDIDINGAIVVLSNKEEKIPIKLRNGRKVIITSRNHNFSNFNHDELIEILRFFDVFISDTSYDHIREEIVKQISIISDVSLVKNEVGK